MNTERLHERRRCDGPPWAVVLMAALVGALLNEARDMAEPQWELSGVRPSSRPQLRIAGAGYLLAHYMDKGLVPGVLELVSGADPIRGHRRLEQGMMVTSDGAKNTFIGRGRAREMVVNTLLPISTPFPEEQIMKPGISSE